jgi:hypothetical protein
LIPSFVVGKRDSYHAKAFMSDLAARVKNRVQLSSDSLKAYEDAVERGFGTNVDYGTVVKPTVSQSPVTFPPPSGIPRRKSFALKKRCVWNAGY